MLLDIVYGDRVNEGIYRFEAHSLGGNDPTNEIVIQWLGLRPEEKRPLNSLDRDQALRVLRAFEKIWDANPSLPALEDDLRKQTAAIIKKIGSQWRVEDETLLKRHAGYLGNSLEREIVTGVMATVRPRRIAETTLRFLLLHALFWIMLIFIYPNSPKVQTVFFWNPWVRGFVGLGYIGFALRWIPFLRQKLFEPFKTSLVSDANLVQAEETVYFPGSDASIKVKGKPQILPLSEAIPEIRGQIILQGDSGLGKTCFLKHIMGRSKRVTVYLPALKCVGERGVVLAIQAKLKGPAANPAFLRDLIYAGALDICIDGLNEVNVLTRQAILEFVDDNFHGNILLTTQRMEWNPPVHAKMVQLRPLSRAKIRDFLRHQLQTLQGEGQLPGRNVEEILEDYLGNLFSSESSDVSHADLILSNPMDLSTVALLLAQGKRPDLLRLPEQQFQNVDELFKSQYGAAFPLGEFAELVYDMRRGDKLAIRSGEIKERFGDDFNRYVEPLVKHKMLLPLPEVQAPKILSNRKADEVMLDYEPQWRFRHDKMMEFFLVQAFTRVPARKAEHLGDSRFSGVYFSLALRLPLEEAADLRETLIQFAARTKDHSVSDRFVILFQSRAESKPSYVF